MSTLNELLQIATTRMLSEEEFAELELLISQQDDTAAHDIIAQFSNIQDSTGMPQEKATSMLEAIFSTGSSGKSVQTIMPVHRVHFLKTAWVRYAAAIILIISAIAVYYNFLHTSQPGNKVAQITPPAVSNDVMPGTNRAVLTLSNGKKITLDSTAAATIKDENIAIENSNGQLNYTNTGTVLMNMMATPKGGQYQLTLADGTKVWLNAASSISYPTAFPGKTREVAITGEAYFEVAKDKSKPFLVKTRKETIEVLGTSFNINAYDDEANVKTSLVEGSVKIGDRFIKPGEAYLDGKVQKTDLQQDVAWKNGFFSFRDADIRTVMRQLARWYDVEVKYEKNVTKSLFDGEIGRSLTLSQVLDILSGARIHYKIENKTIILLSE